MKKIFKLLMVAVMVITLSACGSDKGGSTAKKDTYKVGVAIYKFDDPFMTNYRNALKDYFKEQGKKNNVKYELTIMDGKNDQGEQQNQIENFIAQKMDIIIANLVEPKTADIIVKKCKDANIPIVFINREPDAEVFKEYKDKSTYVGADAKQSGEFQGQMIASLPNKGDYNGDGKLGYVMIQGDVQNIDAKQRTKYSIEEYKKQSNLPVEKLYIGRGDWDQTKGQEIAATALSQYGKDIDVIFCNNDNMAIGALQSIKSAGRTVGKDIALVGVDALEEAQKLVKKGEMTGTVLNDAKGQAKAAGKAAIDLLNGKKVKNHIWVDYIKYDQAYAEKNK